MEPTHSIRPIARFKVSDSIAAQIDQLIQDGTYKPGDRLPSERLLAEQFGVGRSSMREALRALEARGLVNIAHGVGVHIAEQVADDEIAALLVLEGCTVPELFEVRRAIECPAAAAAARRIAPAEVAQLQEILTTMSKPHLTDDQYIEKDAELHRAIVHATHNALLIRVYESTGRLFVEYSWRVIQFPDRRSIADEGHSAIVEAIANRRPQAAQKAMSAHLLAVEKEIVEHLHAAGHHEKAGLHPTTQDPARADGRAR